MRILLTNDDSHDSPLFLLAIDILKELGDLSIAVPAEEQSWQGKSMTRFSPVYVQPTQVGGIDAWSITGTPADCASLAIHNLMDAPPDVVVSGINIGVNTGLGFLLASGTVGACLEANIAGLPALALSQHLAPEEFRQWDTEREFLPETTARLEGQTRALVRDVWAQFIDECKPRITWSVNLPNRPTDATRLVRSHLGLSWYGPVFARHGDQYRHQLQAFERDPHPSSDGVVVHRGDVSITEIDLERLSVPSS